MIREKSYLYDKNSDCHSYLCTVDLDWYLSVIQKPYDEDGNIDGQRAPLTTQTGRRIRKQMVSDFEGGGILPPVVIGVENNSSLKIGDLSDDELIELIEDNRNSDISILDGMQRTTAMKQAVENSTEKKQRFVRVEFWVARKLHSLLYRMLVLNTGQVPWSLRRQVEVVFHSLKTEMKAQLQGLHLIDVDDGNRRVKAGQFHADKLIEIFLIIGTRSERIDVKEKLADDFLKLDFIENASGKELTTAYLRILQIIIDLDIAWNEAEASDKKERFSKGIDIFSSQPAISGFCVAVSQYVFGRPGASTSPDKYNEKLDKICMGFDKLTKKLKALSPGELSEFCALDTLNEYTAPFKKSSKIGDEERSYFRDAFKVLIAEDFNVESLVVCWNV